MAAGKEWAGVWVALRRTASVRSAAVRAASPERCGGLVVPSNRPVLIHRPSADSYRPAPNDGVQGKSFMYRGAAIPHAAIAANPINVWG